MQSNLLCSEQYNPCRWVDQRYGLDVSEIDVCAVIYELGSHEKTANLIRDDRTNNRDRSPRLKASS